MTFTINFSRTVSNINSENTVFNKPNSYVTVNFEQVDDETQGHFKALAAKLHAEIDTTNLAVVSMKMDSQGFYEKDLPSSLGVKEGAIGVYYGRTFVAIDTKHSDLSFQVTDFTFSEGAYSKSCLLVYDDALDLLYPIPLMYNSETWEECLTTNAATGKKVFNTTKIAASVAKGKWDVFASFLKEQSSGSNSTLIDIKTLPLMTPFLVVAFKEVNVTHNGSPAVSYIVTVDNNGQEEAFWLPSNLKQSGALGKVVPKVTRIGYTLTEANKSGKSYVKGFITQSSTISLPSTESVSAKAPLPFTNRASAIEWGMLQLPAATLDEISEMQRNSGSPENYFKKVNEAANQTVVTLDADVAVPF